MRMKKQLTFLTLILIFLPVLVLAPLPPLPPKPPLWDWGEMLKWAWMVVEWVFLNIFGIPAEFLKLSTFVYFVLIPFLAVFIIIYGFLKELGIFRRTRRLDWLLALLISLSMLPTHVFTLLVVTIFNIIGHWSVVMFGVIFIFGTWYFLIYKKGEWASRAAVISMEAERLSLLKRDMKELLERRFYLYEELTTPGISKSKIEKIQNSINAINTEIDKLRSQIAAAEDVRTT